MTASNRSKNQPVRHLRGTQPVYVAASHELLDQMEDGWSPTVQVHLERDAMEPYGWRMTFRTVEVNRDKDGT